MKKNKGFTLIELLAVIVILAILALIAIPIVISIISDSRENAHKRSIETYGRTIENTIAQWQSKHGGELPTENDIDFNTIKTSGEKVKCNQIKGIDSEDGIELIDCYVVDSKGNQKSKDIYTYKNGKVSKLDENTTNNTNNNQTNDYAIYAMGDKITVKNDQYYVISNSGKKQAYLTAIKEKPLTLEEVNNNKIGSDGINHVNRYTWYSVGEAYKWGNNYGSLAFYSNVNCRITGNYNQSERSGCINSYDDSDIKYIVTNWSENKFATDELININGYKARLISYDEVKNIGWPSCLTTDNYCPKESITPNWLYSPNIGNYWLMNIDSGNVWYISGSGELLSYNQQQYDLSNLRPVINIKKTAIQN